MGRVYILPMPNIAVTAQQDFFEVTSPADAITRIHSVHLSQLTEVGDAAEEMLNLLYKRGATTSGTGGTTPTPGPVSPGDAAYGGVCDINNTTKASGGTIVTLPVENWNVRVPYDRTFTPEERLDLSPSQRFTVELATTPADSITIGGWIAFEEIGG